ncbi:MAG: discoidin domain-containing protein, partial [Clostridia bacterium]|nr:discoidin domain-containing protein [Clostridia bacterium]
MMRKLLPSLLAVLLAVSLLTSCLTIPEIPSSEDPSDAVSGEPEPSGSEDVSSSESQEESQTEVLIEYETIVSVGKSYDMTKEPDDKYPDPGHAKLTDGLYADSASYTDEHYAGFQVSAASVRITLDMEEDGNQLYKFGISYLSTNDAGLGPIGACRVFYSLDGEKWTRTNFFIRPTYEEGTKQTAWLTLDTPVNARFVRFDIKGEKGWLFMDELIVVANVKGSSASSNYQTVLRQSYTAASVDPDGLAPGTGKADRVTFTPYQVTNGARYTTSYDSSERYPDKDDLLTDGEDMGRGISSGEYAGYEGGEELNIDVFLNDPVDGICDFALSMYQQSSLGYRLPYYVDFSVSDDGKTYSRVGRVFAPDDPSVTNFIFTLRTESTYSALWIRYSLPKTDSKLFLIEEAYAAAYIPNPNEPLYPEVVIEPTEEPENWPSQNKKTVNLAAGLSYQIEAFETLYAQDETQHNTLASAGVLTDGVYSQNTVYDNGCWNRIRHGSGRNVYFDFGYVSSITGFKANYLNYPSYGIYAASQTTFCVSMNGID